VEERRGVSGKGEEMPAKHAVKFKIYNSQGIWKAEKPVMPLPVTLPARSPPSWSRHCY